MGAVVANLVVREADAEDAGGQQRLIAEAVFGLGGGGAVVDEAVGLDDEVEVRPVEVDPEAANRLLGERGGEIGVGYEIEESALQVRVRRLEGAQETAERLHARAAGHGVEELGEAAGVDEILAVRLIEGGFELSSVERRGEIDESQAG